MDKEPSFSCSFKFHRWLWWEEDTVTWDIWSPNITHTSNTKSKHKISPPPQISACPCSESLISVLGKLQSFPKHIFHICQQTFSATPLNSSRHLHLYHPLHATSWWTSHPWCPFTNLFSTQSAFWNLSLNRSLLCSRDSNAFLRKKAQILTVPSKALHGLLSPPFTSFSFISLLSLLLSSHQTMGHIAAGWKPSALSLRQSESFSLPC